ncbi:uncharacterized protein LOC141651774 [Silene latifolia]|uniref:uncharacterized protein LOC141651774 n=1 Tax=Silene latifolia TaxID=37657 RepID=UPI003D77B897
MFLFDGKPVIVRPWEPNTKITKVSVKTVPIWVKLVGLDLKFWGAKCLEKLASLIGKFVRVDDLTLDRTLLGFARVMVEVGIDQIFPEKINFLDELGQNVTVAVEYDWLPVTCTKCKGIGHKEAQCRKGMGWNSRPAQQLRQPPNRQVWKRKEHTNTHADHTEFPPLSKEGSGNPQPGRLGIVTRVQQGNGGSSATTPTITPVNTSNPVLTPARILTRITRHESRLQGGKEGVFMVNYKKEMASVAPMVDKGGGGEASASNGVKPGSLNKVVDSLCHGWNYCTNHQYHAGGRIWLLWKDRKYKVNVLDMEAQFIHVKVEDIINNYMFYVTFVYGFNKIEERIPLWDAMVRLTLKEPWIIMGDFNNVLHMDEKIGLPVKDSETMPFQDAIDRCGLQDMKCTGSFFTWNNKQPNSTRVFSRIDRVLVNDEWLTKWPDYFAHYAPEGEYDHCPCFIRAGDTTLRQKRPFKFFNMWTGVPDFLMIVENGWNENVYGTRMYKVRHLHDDPHNTTLRDNEYNIRASFQTLHKAKIEFLRQKAKCEWARDGDSNSAMFHKAIRQRQLANKVLQIEDINGQLCNTPEGIMKAFEDYYQELLGVQGTTEGFMATIVSRGDRVQQTDWPILRWNIMGEEICEAVTDFFRDGKLLKQLNCTNLVLIPKVKNPNSVKEFRPLSCCNTLYKWISRKAYDSIEWAFVHQIMLVLNFPPKFVQLVMQCISTTTFSIALNGNMQGFFNGKRGLRQRDHLSPLLFTLCMEYLSRLLDMACQGSNFHYHPLCRGIKLTHFMLADDLLLFCKGTMGSVFTLVEAFECFSNASGLHINNEKTDIMFNGMQSEMEDLIMQETGFKKGTLPFKYLGVNISHKKLSKLDCNILIDKMIHKIKGWNKRRISYTGRMVLVRSVLATLHNYWAKIFVLPVGVMDKIQALCRNFLWEGSDDYSKAPLISWKVVCSSLKAGGLGLIDSKDWNVAAVGKLVWWIFIKKDILWIRWIDKIYMKGKPSVMPPKVEWYSTVWNNMNLPKHRFIAWLIKHKRLLTLDRLCRMGVTVQTMQLGSPEKMMRLRKITGFRRKLLCSLVIATQYNIWHARNVCRMEHKVLHPVAIVKSVQEAVKSVMVHKRQDSLAASDINWCRLKGLM